MPMSITHAIRKVQPIDIICSVNFLVGIVPPSGEKRLHRLYSGRSKSLPSTSARTDRYGRGRTVAQPGANGGLLWAGAVNVDVVGID